MSLWSENNVATVCKLKIRSINEKKPLFDEKCH